MQRKDVKTYFCSNPIDDCVFNFLPSGESPQQNETNTETNQNKSSLSQQLGPMQVPNNLCSANSPVQQEEVAAEESPGLSSESNQEETPATTDPDNKDLARAEEKGTGFTGRSSAAVINTPEKAETGERQREDIASEVKQLNHLYLRLC